MYADDVQIVYWKEHQKSTCGKQKEQRCACNSNIFRLPNAETKPSKTGLSRYGTEMQIAIALSTWTFRIVDTQVEV